MKKHLSFTKTIVLVFLFLSSLSINAQCSAGFNFTVGTNGNVNFASTSTGIGAGTYYYWDFGDNSGLNNYNNPLAAHTYSNNQTFTVTLYISDSTTTPACYSNFTQTISISNAPCLGNAAFTYVQGSNGGVYFYDSSNTATGSTYAWSFGDGGVSTQSSPNYTYAAAGVYTVNLTVTTPSAQCTYTTTQTITVSIIPCNLNASFTYTLGSNGSVNFTSTSSGTTSTTVLYWYFGDGGSANGTPVSHSYTSNGLFTVSLVLYDSITSNCIDTTSQQITLTNAPCTANSTFSMYKDSTQLPAIVWDAYPNYGPNVLAANWSWGDGSSSNSLYPSHTYSAAGMYNVCLSVTVSCGASSTTCINSNINRYSGTDQTNAIATINVINTTTGIKNNTAGNSQIAVFPNPNSGEFEIKLNGVSNSLIEVYNVVGQKVYHAADAETTSKKISLNEMPSGTYFIKVSTDKGVYNSKFIIAK